MVFTVIGKKGFGTIDGIELKPDVLIINAPDVKADLVVEPGYESMSVKISPRYLNGDTSMKVAADRFRVPGKFYFKKIKNQDLQALFDLGIKIVRAAEKHGMTAKFPLLMRATNLE